jgi:hypothetical protein
VVDDTVECQEAVPAVFGPTCAIYSFWWSKPHKEIKHKLVPALPTEQAKYLKLMSVNTEGITGKNGMVGFAKIRIHLTNGKAMDLLSTAKKQFPMRVRKGTSKLFLKTEGELMDIQLPKLPAGIAIKAISVQADSWINPNTEAQVQIWFGDKKTEFVEVQKP